MRLVTWNVNSIRARGERLFELLDALQPDIAFLQETKVDAAHFPHLELAARGYAAADWSGGRWCGVAVLAPTGVPITDVVLGLEGEREPDQARWIEATVGGVRCVSTYVPNGQLVGSEPFESKLVFYAAAARRIGRLAASGPLAVAGDMNVAPTDLDVWDPAAFVGSTHVTPVERRAHAVLMEAGGLVDAYRALHPGEGPEAHTWWDYRAGAYHKRQGLRIDHVLLSASLADHLTGAHVDRAYRKGSKPSDHAPVVIDLAAAP
jgi:exodeoxyribonuclease III